MSNKKFYVGIDLGTTNSVVACYREGRPEVIQNDSGSRTTPSCVAFTDTELLVGKAAISQSEYNPKNTIHSIKRLIGRKFNDRVVQEAKKNLPYDVVEKDGKLKVKVMYRGKESFYTPEEISAFILKNLIESAEVSLECKITKVVITIPAYFDDAQRSATIEAAKLAGFDKNNLKMLTEPTAAAMCYGYNQLEYNSTSKALNKTILVFDFGGGTFDVSILKMKGNELKVLAYDGDNNLGGEDIDTNLVEYMIKQCNIDIVNNQKRQQVKNDCRKLKTQLSTSDRGFVVIDDKRKELSRANFDDINNNIYEKTINVTKSVIRQARIESKDIDDIVLAGGSTRIKTLREKIKEYFRKESLSQTVNPDEAVGIGAAIQAHILFGDPAELDVQKAIKLIADKCPYSISTDIEGGKVHVIIPKNTPIPTIKKHSYKTCSNRQTTVVIRIYEGESQWQKDNKQMAQLTIQDIPKSWLKPRSIECTFSLDENSILSVTATVEKTKKSLTTTIEK